MPPAGFMPKQFPAARSLKSLTGALVSLQFESCHVFPPSLDSSHHCSRLQADLILYTARVTIESCEAGPDHVPCVFASIASLLLERSSVYSTSRAGRKGRDDATNANNAGGVREA